MKKLLFIFLFLASASALSNNAQGQVAIIANSNVKASSVSKSDLHDVFTGAASSLGNGAHVVPVLLKSGSVTTEFLAAYVGKPEAAFLAGWRSMLFSGQASMPKTLDSDAAMVEYVADTPGAIGYISQSAPHDGVQVLPVK